MDRLCGDLQADIATRATAANDMTFVWFNSVLDANEDTVYKACWKVSRNMMDPESWYRVTGFAYAGDADLDTVLLRSRAALEAFLKTALDESAGDYAWFVAQGPLDPSHTRRRPAREFIDALGKRTINGLGEYDDDDYNNDALAVRVADILEALVGKN